MIGQYVGRLMTKVAIRGMVVMTPVAYATEEIHIVDLRDYVPRSGEWKKRPEEAIEGLIIHHTASKGLTFRQIAQMHIDQKGWESIAYHYGWSWAPDGEMPTLYMFNDPTDWTNHAKGWNYRTVGAALMGNYENIVMTREQVLACLKLESYLVTRYGISYTKFHRETKQTLCPGGHAVAALDTALVLR